MLRDVRAVFLVLVSVVALLNVQAAALSPEALARMIDQLGADEFEQRQAAEKTLTEQSTNQPEETRPALAKRLSTERDPEIRFRLNRILGVISGVVPSERVPFTKAALAAKRWQILGKKPEEASYQFKEDLLEIYSLDKVEEGMGFVHRFRGLDAEEEKLKIGPRPKPVSERFVLDVELKIIKEHHVRRGLAGMHLNVEDHRSSAGLIILEDGFSLYRHQQVHKMDTTDRWHHFRFVIEGDNQWVFVDDMEKPVFKVARPRKAGRWWATFGDGTSGAGVHAEIRKVTFARYEVKPEADAG